MHEINQNFPSFVSSLSRMKLNDSIKEEIITNQRMVPPGKSLMALNGALINIEEVDLYMLIDMIHEELSMADQFSELKLPQNAILKLLSSPPPSESNTLRIDFRSTYVHYLNNLEEDAMYRRWRSNINEILMPVFPGQLRYIRKNLFNAIYVIDPTTTCGAEAIDMIQSMFQKGVPMRFGVILYSSKLIKHIEEDKGHLPMSSEDDDFKNDISSLIIRLFLYIKETYDSQLAFQFLNNVIKLKDATDVLNEEPIQVHQVEEAFVETVISKANFPPQEMLLKLEKEDKYKETAEMSSHFVYKLGLSKLQCCLLLNGLVHESTEDACMNAMNEELPRIQEQVYYGQITSNTDVLDKFLSESGYRRYNPQVVGDGKEIKKFISLFKPFLAKDSILHDISYLHSPGTLDDLKPVTHLLAVNVKSRKEIKLLREGLHYMMGDSRKARLGVLIYVDVLGSSSALFLAEIFDKVTSKFSDKKNVLNFLDEVCSLYEGHYMHAHASDIISMDNFIEKVCELALANDLPPGDFRSTLSNFSAAAGINKLNKVSYFLHGQLGLKFGSNAIITNGRVFDSENVVSFSRDDLELLESVEYQHRIKHISEIIHEVEWSNADPDELTSKFYSDVIMLVSSAMSNRARSSDRAHFEILNAKHSGNSSIHIDAVIDPLSASGQKLAPMILLLWRHIQPSIRIVLNPMDDFSPTDHSVSGPKAFFTNMPFSKTLTMNLDVPEPWLVEPTITIHDLDNILLENLGDTRTLQAVFELEALLLTGHCSEKDHDPPRGLQLILGTKQKPHLVDTLVMSNLGYWQMKVSPGVWYLKLAPGRSADLYVMNTNEGSQSSLSKHIIINDLRGRLVHLEVVKKKGKEHDELLSDSDDLHLKEKKEDRNGWNGNLLKWASGIIAGNGLSRRRNERLLDSFCNYAEKLLINYTTVLPLTSRSEIKSLDRFQGGCMWAGGGVMRPPCTGFWVGSHC
ncbi:UDP-glucose:glycoprotein glucosyltransferase [Platanthera guangdongensis]|uniref:UDP-glucose:glycoprotein glucosyltransferase n=1 Tax=Platanthera guangdongensis TaxID=2320717 RepID=A0ABR2MLU7_9ASPA